MAEPRQDERYEVAIRPIPQPFRVKKMYVTHQSLNFRTAISTTALTETLPTFVYLYDREINDNSIKFCKRIAKGRGRINHTRRYIHYTIRT